MFIWHSQINRKCRQKKFTYNGQGIAFDGKGFWSFDEDITKNVLIFGVNNSSSFHVDNPKSNFFVLGEGPTASINVSVGIAEKKR